MIVDSYGAAGHRVPSTNHLSTMTGERNGGGGILRSLQVSSLSNYYDTYRFDTSTVPIPIKRVTATPVSTLSLSCFCFPINPAEIPAANTVARGISEPNAVHDRGRYCGIP